MAPKASPSAVLMTSLSPKGNEARQNRAIASWQAAGFSLASLNSEDECRVLNKRFTPWVDKGVLDILPIQHTAAEVADGRPLVFINDLLAVGASRGVEVVGVINDDILLSANPQAYEVLRQEATQALIMGRRFDVDELPQEIDADTTTGRPAYGYDMALMPADWVSQLPRQPFCLGMPQWDFWLPLTLMLQGQPIKRLETPLMWHENHDGGWAGRTMFFAHRLILQVLEQTVPGAAGLPAAFHHGLVSHLYNTTVKEAGEASEGDDEGYSAVARLAWQHDRFIEYAEAFIRIHSGQLDL